MAVSSTLTAEMANIRRFLLISLTRVVFGCVALRDQPPKWSRSFIALMSAGAASHTHEPRDGLRTAVMQITSQVWRIVSVPPLRR